MQALVGTINVNKPVLGPLWPRMPPPSCLARGLLSKDEFSGDAQSAGLGLSDWELAGPKLLYVDLKQRQDRHRLGRFARLYSAHVIRVGGKRGV